MDASALGLLDELLDAAVEVGGVAAVLAGHVGAVGRSGLLGDEGFSFPDGRNDQLSISNYHNAYGYEETSKN